MLKYSRTRFPTKSEADTGSPSTDGKVKPGARSPTATGPGVSPVDVPFFGGSSLEQADAETASAPNAATARTSVVTDLDLIAVAIPSPRTTVAAA
jgi:hypothetical protein